MERKYSGSEQAMSVAKEAVFLAWQACGGPQGMGVFQDRGPNQDRETVWEHAFNRRDYDGLGKQAAYIDCDYVMGRMMKLSFRLNSDTIKHDDYPPRGDYQAWCHRYKTFDALFDAAEAAVGVTHKQAA